MEASIEPVQLEQTQFYLLYPLPFLEYYYATFPEEDTNIQGHSKDAS